MLVSKILLAHFYLSNRLHGASDFRADSVKFAQIPPRDLDNAVIETRLETGRRFTRHRIDLKKDIIYFDWRIFLIWLSFEVMNYWFQNKFTFLQVFFENNAINPYQVRQADAQGQLGGDVSQRVP